MRVMALVLIILSTAGEARADALILKDAERVTVHESRRVERRVIEYQAPVLVVPPKCCTGYVGSAYGLGKPNYYGISPRPDDGYGCRC
jgi:hypothetical protein